MMNILLTSVSRKVYLVKAFQEALKMEGGGKVIAADASALAPALYFADEKRILPRLQAESFLPEVVSICNEFKVKAIVPTRDEELLFFAEHAIEFSKIGVKVLVCGPEAISICQDKQKFISFCNNNGFNVPRQYSRNDITAGCFPLFIKPREGKGSKMAFRVDSMEHLDILLKENGPVIIQEFIKDPEYTVDIFSDFNGNVISAVPRLRMYTVGGESFTSKTSKIPAIMNEAIKLAEKLKLVGQSTIQCFFNEKQVRFIEINLRYGGAAHLGLAAGANTPRFTIQLLKGVTVKPCIGNFSDNLYMLRYTDDIFISEEKLNSHI